MTNLVHVRRDGVSLVVDARSESDLPHIVHWGADLGELGIRQLEAVVDAARPINTLGTERRVEPGLIAQHAAGGYEYPGIIGARRGRAWSPLFRPSSFSRRDDGGRTVLNSRAVEPDAGLELTTTIEMTESGLLRTRAELRNQAEDDYEVHSVTLAVPVPDRAVELLDFVGRHGLERVPVRQSFEPGLRMRESRQGRAGHDAAFLTVAGEAGFGFQQGEVWSTHTAWSGNHRTFSERLATAGGRIGGGELLWPGEMRLRSGQSYATPWMVCSYGLGLDDLSHRYHQWVRRLPHIASRRRRITVNSWEAVYFDLTAEKLSSLATAAAAVGADRVVVDDGWFGQRLDDTTSLGDWVVDADRWPNGLGAVADRVRDLGMEFGLWFEPEMISPNSDLARGHPEWVVRIGPREPVLSRHQAVLDLTVAAAFEEVKGRMSELIRELGVSFLKWDYNRAMIDSADQEGSPSAHCQVMACYRLMDELKADFPTLEIESCSSGGARIDLEMASRVHRFWPSDNTDPYDRQSIQLWTSLLIPPELLGAHVARPVSPTTGRTSSVAFRAGTALLGDFGIEWDITDAGTAERELLARWVRLAIEWREVVATGKVTRISHPDPGVVIIGVISEERKRALFSIVATASTVRSSLGRIAFPGLDQGTAYAVSSVAPEHSDALFGRPVWLEKGTILTGRALSQVGLEFGDLQPGAILLIGFDESGAA